MTKFISLAHLYRLSGDICHPVKAASGEGWPLFGVISATVLLRAAALKRHPIVLTARNGRTHRCAPTAVENAALREIGLRSKGG